MALEAPFTGKPSRVMEVQHRFSGLRLAARERPRPRHRVRSRPPLAHDRARRPVEARSESRKVLFDLSINDAYNDPGVPVTVTRPDGTRTILQDGDSIYLTGQGASPQGSRPFLDKLDLKTVRKESPVPLRREGLRVAARLRRAIHARRS